MARFEPLANRRAILLDASLILRDFTTATAISATTAEKRQQSAIRMLLNFATTKQLWMSRLTLDMSQVRHNGQSPLKLPPDNSTFVPVGTVIPTGVANRFQIPLSGEWVEKESS
ncbi:hypothetical protein FD724_06655 [Nostoc sp. C057]|uniref:hypothetical protein n=1 Tax=Nostoc sp. C057 TaxID=2576903 RepID=UPI0015C36EEA|nr:hypothetical protein [Nostoc sp. C057]QLE47820.1 hypothetical protein FD724_06655 [Nostoc sp. C057]